jgi:hypothetical protein
MNDGVIFYKSHFDNIKDLTDAELGQIFRACMTGETGAMAMHVKMAYNFVSSQIRRDEEKYTNIIEKRRAAGRKGGIAKGKRTDNQDNEEIANQANAIFAKQEIANQANESNNINTNSNNNNNINRNNNNNIKNDTSNDVSINTATPSVDSLKEKSSWIEMVAMNYGLDVQGVHRWIDKFQLEVIDCKLKTHANNKDLASHFCDWLRIKLAAESAQRKPNDRMKSTNDKLAAYIQTLSS